MGNPLAQLLIASSSVIAIERGGAKLFKFAVNLFAMAHPDYLNDEHSRLHAIDDSVVAVLPAGWGFSANATTASRIVGITALLRLLSSFRADCFHSILYDAIVF